MDESVCGIETCFKRTYLEVFQKIDYNFGLNRITVDCTEEIRIRYSIVEIRVCGSGETLIIENSSQSLLIFVKLCIQQILYPKVKVPSS